VGRPQVLQPAHRQLDHDSAGLSSSPPNISSYIYQSRRIELNTKKIS
jgi:hypothetical protein